MMFLLGAEGTMVLFLTEQDVNDMRPGRTKYVDETATKGGRFKRVVLSLHKNQAEVEDALRKSGHGALLQNAPSPQAKPGDGRCDGCRGIMPEPLLLGGKCIVCWKESAEMYRRSWLDEVSQNE